MPRKAARSNGTTRLPTVSTISKVVGFSASTVSRALSGDPRISAGTRDAIVKVAREQGYSPNIYARSLVAGSSGIVAIVLDRMANPFYGELVERLHLRLVEIGKFPMLLKFGGDSIDAEMKAIQPLIGYRMDGCIIASAPLSSKAAEVCARYRLPMVMINRVARDHACAVSCNNYKGGLMVGQLLADAHHRRIAFLGGREDTSTSEDREFGLRQALSKAKLQLVGRVLGHYTYEGGFAAARELLKARPDAIFAANDIMALGAIDAVRDAGLKVPGDISVIGFDDIQAASWHNYRLTTVAQPVDAMMSRALALLEERIQNPDLKSEDVSIQGELRIRHSARLPEPVSALADES